MAMMLPEVSLDEASPASSYAASDTVSVDGEPSLCDVSFEALVHRKPPSRLLQTLIDALIAKGHKTVAERVARTTVAWWKRLCPQLAQEAFDKLLDTASHRFAALDSTFTDQLVRASHLVLRWATHHTELEERTHQLREANERVSSLEAEMEAFSHVSTPSSNSTLCRTPSLELCHLRDAALQERAALQKCVDEVEEKLAETEAELLKTKRATKLAEARLNDSKLEELRLRQHAEQLHEQLLQVEVFKQSDSGAVIEDLESELAECRMQLAQAEEDNDNLDFELSQLKEGSIASSLNASFDAQSPPDYQVRTTSRCVTNA